VEITFSTNSWLLEALSAVKARAEKLALGRALLIFSQRSVPSALLT